MNEQEWRAARDSRSLRYADRVLDPKRWILIRADTRYAARYDGQVAVLTAANLLARMTPAVALDVPSVPLVTPLPWAGRDLREYTLAQMAAADPYGLFTCRTMRDGDYLIHLGPTGAERVAHGSGWNIYLGPASPLVAATAANPIGPALTAILAAATAFRTNLTGVPETILLNAFDWRQAQVPPDRNELPSDFCLGDIWTAGCGSVGTAILYFLTLATRSYSTAVFDMDVVKIHNLDRSPIFLTRQVGMRKVAATRDWLQQAGVTSVRCEPFALDGSMLWLQREAGTPDILVAAANERNVRAVIEHGFPPIQIYGTTGRNWQAAVIRHVPLTDPCSSCLFPESEYAPTHCATSEMQARTGEPPMDAALPFLSFGAGAMAAAEILKLALPGYPFSRNRVVLNTQPLISAVSAGLTRREGCICQHRSSNVHRDMISGSRYASIAV